MGVLGAVPVAAVPVVACAVLVWPAGVQGSCVGVRKSLNTFDIQSMIDRVVFNMLKWLVSNSDLW